MNCTEQQADELLTLVRPMCTHKGKADLRMGVDLINGMLCKFYYQDEPGSLNITGDITKESVKHALLAEDSLTIDWFIKELKT